MIAAKSLLPAAIALIGASQLAAADRIEEILVSDSKPGHNRLAADIAATTAADAAALLRGLPGANANSIGALSGIAQYRGLSGERIAVQLDGSPVFSGGPNAMDAPLSYAPSLLLNTLSVTRGIASVSSAQESLGGHIQARLNRGQFADSEAFQASSQLSTGYRSVNNSTRTALRGTLANQNHKTSLLISHDEGNNSEFADGELAGTQFNRTRYDLSYGYRNGDTRVLLYAGHNDTEDTGTPALAMDINFIDTDLAGFTIATSAGAWQLNGFANYSDVDHGMDNFSQRQAPASPMMFRNIDVQADHLSFGINGATGLAGGTLTLGYDASRSTQDSTIFNPNNSVFLIHNFNDIQRDIDGLFAQWHGKLGHWSVEAGVRYNQVDAVADTVAALAVPPPLAGLAQSFNQANRNLSFSYTDLVIKASHALNNHTRIDIGLGQKHRAPSYQELFLWAPLPITGGLADGRSYIGNLGLKEERAHEVTLGLTWESGAGYFSPQLFFRDIDDYIQGTPATNMAANMVSTLLSGAPAQQFGNVDAQLYGLDAGYGIVFNQNWRLDGSISYVQGQRSDANDYLYRIAPLNHNATLSYQQDHLRLQLESVLYASQGKVASFNNEQPTTGYGLINLRAHYDITRQLTLSGGIENLFDKGYQDHLAGYNRIGNSDVAIGDRMFGAGQNVYVAVRLTL